MGRDGGGDGTADDDAGPSSPTLAELADEVRERRRRGVDLDPTGDAGDPDHREPGARAGASPPWSSFGSDDRSRPISWSSTDPKTEAIVEIIGGASNVLLAGPLLCPADHDICTRLIAGVHEDADNLLVVTLTQSPDERLNVLRGYLDRFPARTAVLNVGDSTRSGSKETVSVDGAGSITIESIPDPTDLMRIGIAISKQLSDWGDADGRTIVCFHSVTALLQFVDDPKTVFRFLHVLRGQIQAADATAHYHLDAGAHDDQLLATFRPLFDEVLTFTEDGSLSVSR